MTIIFLLISGLVIGQKIMYNTTEPNGDSTYWYKFQTTQARKLGLDLLVNSTHPEHLRIWTNKQVLDLWIDKNDSLFGKLTTWADEYVGGKEPQTNRTFVKTKLFISDTAHLLHHIATTGAVLSLPTDDSIKGWQHGFDGTTYIIEHSTTVNYSFKSYWTPKSQDSLKEALQIQSFIDGVFTLANAGQTWKEFSQEIPFESYWNGGPGIAVRILTEKERKKYRIERERYRKADRKK